MTIDLFEEDLLSILQRFGASGRSVRLLENSARLTPRDQLEYADLIQPSATRRGLVSAVVEAEGKPFLYVVRRTTLTGKKGVAPSDIKHMQQILACRAPGTFLAIVDTGLMTVYPCALGSQAEVIVEREAEMSDAPSLIQELIGGAPWQNSTSEGFAADEDKTRKWFHSKSAHNVLLRSINLVAKNLRESSAVRNEDCASELVLSLIGRALLARFLIDRGIIRRDTFPDLWHRFPKSAPRCCFDTAEAAALTSSWLDRTFNGDLLNLPCGMENYEVEFHRISQKDPGFFDDLGCLLYPHCEGRQLRLPLWRELDFAHIPVGLLSEVYEDFAHRYSSQYARQTSVHFTPRHIAELMVTQACGALQTCSPADVRVLDPAAGAGVFLAVAFRRIYLETWERNLRDGRPRPGTDEIRRILYEQLRGFDINKDALTLAALTLYLTAIELDPEPFPPAKLRFHRNVLGNVLFNVGNGQQSDLGSLGTAVDSEHDGAYDLVIGNPPWTSLSKKNGRILNQAANAIAGRVIARSSSEGNACSKKPNMDRYINPDQVPDIPFLWRSMEWAKPGGMIAFALHARLLFKSAKAAQARAVLFRHLRVTGILNGAALRQVKQVWPGISAPFCLLFAMNSKPKAEDVFHYISPFLEEHINQKGLIRIDPRKVEPISFKVLEREPTLLKTLFRGDALDVSIIRKINADVFSESINALKAPLLTYLNEKGFQSAEGFQRGKAKNQKDASHLLALNGKMLTADIPTGIVIDADNLPIFDAPRLQWPRRREIYQPPILLVREAPSVDESRFQASAYFGSRPLIYSEAFTGYRAEGELDEKAVMLYLAAIMSSPIFRYYMLMTSAKYGIERDAWNSIEVKQFPIVRFERLSEDLRKQFEALADRAGTEKSIDMCAIENLVYDVYGLSESEIEAIRDTLSVAQPTRSSKNNAQRYPSKAEVMDFAQCLESILRPMLELAGLKARVQPRFDEWRQFRSWIFLDLVGDNVVQTNPELINKLVSVVADHEGCSMTIDCSGGVKLIRVGILAQYRFWLKSRAKLFADSIFRAYDNLLAS